MKEKRKKKEEEKEREHRYLTHGLCSCSLYSMVFSLYQDTEGF